MLNLLSRLEFDADQLSNSQKKFGLGHLWFLLCLLRNGSLSLRGRTGPTTNVFRPVSSAPVSGRSPGRYLIDLFLRDFDWERWLDGFRSDLRVVDFGCGDGRYGPLFQELLEKFSITYLGLDVARSENWSELESPAIRFEEIDGSDREIPEFDVIVTVTSLEHIEDDNRLLDQIQTIAHSQGWPSLQVHIVPAPRALFLYKLHGYRQYSLSRLWKQFREPLESGHIEIWGLGGRAAQKVHKDFVRGPLVFRGTSRKFNQSDYLKAVEYAVDLDKKEVANQQPIFWAVVVRCQGLVVRGREQL